MLFEDITILDENLEAKEHMYVGIRDEEIAYVSDVPPTQEMGDWGRKISGSGKLLMSGFFNSHGHSPMTLLRGYGENLPLDRWLTERIFPFEAKLTGESIYWGTLLAIAESVRFGIVSTTDMYYMLDDMARAIDESGCKNNLSRGVTHLGEEDFRTLPIYKELETTFHQYNGASEGRIRIDMSLHAEYTNSEDTARAMAELAQTLGARMHVHVSETAKEHAECKARHGGKTPTAFLASCGLFDVPATAAHCVHVEEDDVQILGEKGVTVAVNPNSNMKLASGICDVARLLEGGVSVAIGTDSVASNNNLNMLEEIKAFALGPKVAFASPESISPMEALRAATRSGALGQGREDTGLLKEGYRADLVVIDIDTPWMTPCHDLRTNLVYSGSGSDVVMTLVDGKVLYEDGEWTTIDVEKVQACVTEETRKILAQL